MRTLFQVVWLGLLLNLISVQGCIDEDKAKVVGNKLSAEFNTKICKAGIKPGSKPSHYKYIMDNIFSKYLAKKFSGCAPPGNLKAIVKYLKPCNKPGDNYCTSKDQKAFGACAKKVADDKGLMAGLAMWLMGCCPAFNKLINEFEPNKMNIVKKDLTAAATWAKTQK